APFCSAQPFQDAMQALKKKDYQKAFEIFRPLAEKGNTQAQVQLGQMYREGQGVPQDNAEALNWYRKAADQGSDEAQYNLGAMYRDGQGVAKNDAEALRWYRKAAEHG